MTTQDHSDVQSGRAAEVICRFEKLRPYDIFQKEQIIVD